MTKVLLLAASLGLCVSSSQACEFQRSAKVDTTVVASVAPPEAPPVSVPVAIVAQEPAAAEEPAE